MVTLRIAPVDGPAYEMDFNGETIIIGRSATADLALHDPLLSRQHARLSRVDGKWMVEDLKSSNGTFLNGTSVMKPLAVRHGDAITIGKFSIAFLEKQAGPSVEMLPEQDALEGTTFRSAADLLAKHEEMPKGPQVSGDVESPLVKYTERLKIINQIHSALGLSVSLEELLGLILDRAFEHLKPEQAAVFLKNKAGEFVAVAVRSLPGIKEEMRVSRSLVSEVAAKGMAALVFDTASDARFAAAESLVISGIRSLIAAPLMDPEGSLGMIVLNSRLAARTFTEEDLELLVSLASVAALKIKNAALAEEGEQRKRLEQEVALARQIQLALLPDKIPAIPGYAVIGRNIPSRGVSGDYFEVRDRLGGKEWVFFIADVSGKGMAASLLTASLAALSEAPFEDGLLPHEISLKLSRGIFRRTPPEKYATAFLAILEPESGRVRYTNAGHNPALVVRSASVESLSATGPPIGLLPNPKYETKEIVLSPGDTLILYTDGITEANDPEEEEYGLPRLEEVVQKSYAEPVQQMASAIEDDLNKFVKGVPFADDRTIVMVRRRKDDQPVETTSSGLES